MPGWSGFDVRLSEFHAGASRPRTRADEVTAAGWVAESAADAAAGACGEGPLAGVLGWQQGKLDQVIGEYGAAVADWGTAVDASAETYREADAAAAAAFDRILRGMLGGPG